MRHKPCDPSLRDLDSGSLIAQRGFQMLSQDTLDKIREFVEAHRELVAIYVFGSAATGKRRKTSDFDLAVMTNGPMSGSERVELETSLSNLLLEDVDLVLFGPATPLLKHQILKYGRLLYEADPQERVRQEVSARREYLDSLFLYRKFVRKTADGR
jgi:uncharacterized protein